MAKLAKLTMYTSGKPIYFAIDKIVSIYETELYKNQHRTTIKLKNHKNYVRESLEETAKIIEAAAPAFVFNNINTK